MDAGRTDVRARRRESALDAHGAGGPSAARAGAASGPEAGGHRHASPAAWRTTSTTSSPSCWAAPYARSAADGRSAAGTYAICRRDTGLRTRSGRQRSRGQLLTVQPAAGDLERAATSTSMIVVANGDCGCCNASIGEDIESRSRIRSSRSPFVPILAMIETGALEPRRQRPRRDAGRRRASRVDTSLSRHCRQAGSVGVPASG